MKNTESLIEDIQSLDRVLNPRPSEYEAVLPITRYRRLFGNASDWEMY